MDVDDDVHAQQESRREPGHSGLPVGRRLSESHSAGLAGRRVLRLVRGAQLRHRRAAARLARPLSPQQSDGGHGRDRSRSAQAISGGTCNDSLNAIIGDPNPKWMGSFLNEFTIGKKLRVRALLDGVFGNKIMNLSTRAQNAGIASNSKEYERELLPYGDPRKLPPGFNARTQGIFEYWVEDGTFVKLRELSASYTLDTTGGATRVPRRHRPHACPAAICACGRTTAATIPRSTCSARTPAASARCRRRRPIAASTSAATPFRACGRSARDSLTERGDHPCA